MANNKMKGLFKGLRYISQILDEEKEREEEELQIGIPTDVKHVAHVGSDGPSNDTPSWMKGFKSSTAPSSAGPKGDDDPDVKWVSEDSKRGNKVSNSPIRDTQEAPRSSRRDHTSEGNDDSDSLRRKCSSAKPRTSRRPKESSEGKVKPNRSSQTSDEPAGTSTRPKKSSEGRVKSNRSSQTSDAPAGNPPDMPKKTRRKKSKESVSGNDSTQSRTKATAAPTPADDDSV